MTVRADGSTEIETYWSPFSDDGRGRGRRRWTEPELEERLLELLRESIRRADDVRRPVRRLPLGRRRLVDERRADVRADGRAGAHVLGRLRASTSATTSSSTRARSRSKFGTDHHEVVIDAHDLESFLPELIYHQDEPLADWVCGAAPLRLEARARQRDDRRPDRRGLGRALPRLPELPLARALPLRATGTPFQRVPAPVRRARPRAVSRSRDREARAARAGDRGGGRGPDPVLGRRDRLPGRAQGPRAHERPRASGLVRRRRALLADEARPTPTCCRR